MTTRGMYALCSVVVFLALPCGLLAQAALTDDADSKGSGPNVNVTPSSNVYLRFDPASTLPANTPGSSVARATVELYLGAVKSPGTVAVYQIGSPWNETTVGSTPPILGAIVQPAVLIQSDQQGRFLVVDVTSAVQQWL
ncbi:MAG: hypothetical protein ACXW19_11480, partial [Thermoanaerobaculia bacterium]